MRPSLATIGLGAALLCSLPACASYYLVGAAPHQGVPPGAPSYRVGACENPKDHSKLDSPTGKTYYVTTADTGMVLVVIDNETLGGDEIRNRWSDAEADHFFTYKEGGGPGWHYALPGDRSRPGKLFTYDSGSYATRDVDGRIHPDGRADSECTLVPQSM